MILNLAYLLRLLLRHRWRGWCFGWCGCLGDGRGVAQFALGQQCPTPPRRTVLGPERLGLTMDEQRRRDKTAFRKD